MADITISITIPDAYVNRLKSAIDNLDPLVPTITYPQQLKNVLRRFLQAYIRQNEVKLNNDSIIVNNDVLS